jgi:thymidine phosphorylase
VGIEFFAKIGRRVKAGEVLGVVYGRASTKLQDAISVLQEAVQFGDDARPPALVLARIGDDDNGPQVS